jgi:DNA-binding transcriptional ArsR family regulator
VGVRRGPGGPPHENACRDCFITSDGRGPVSVSPSKAVWLILQVPLRSAPARSGVRHQEWPISERGPTASRHGLIVKLHPNKHRTVHSRTPAETSHEIFFVYALTSICSAEYTKRVASVFEIIAEPNRRAILSLLISSQHSVGEIERQLRMPQPAVSKHLRVLRDAGFVESTVDAQRRLYRLKPEPFQEVDAWLAPFRRFWSAHVDALERHLDRLDRSTPTKGKTKEKTTRPKPRT